MDKGAVLQLANQLKIDGIMSFACDPGVVTAAYVAEKMGLPSCGNYEAVSILQNKARFRQFLTDNGFNVPKIHSYNTVEAAMNDRDTIEYPVIVKPVDSAGSKGVTRVNSAEELLAAVKHAFDYSIRNFKIPLPSVEEQKKIVSFLDKIDVLVNDISEGLPAEIEARRKQYEYYRNKLLSFEEVPSE